MITVPSAHLGRRSAHSAGEYAQGMPDGQDVLASYRAAGEAAARAATSGMDLRMPGGSAAFFDVDNTLIRGASMFHLAAGLAKRKYFTGRQIWGFGVKQLRFVLSGSEDLEDIASVVTAALSFVEGRRVDELAALGEEIFDEVMIDKLITGTLAIAQAHLDAGRQVWLVTATPVEIATVLAARLGLTGALGTVSEIEDGRYTGRLVGKPLHGLAKAEAVKALAEEEGLDLAACWAYSDSSNDIPMLSSVGHPVAVNPEPALRSHARQSGWDIKDFRRREQFKRAAVPAMSTAAGVAAGMAVGYLIGKAARRP